MEEPLHRPRCPYCGRLKIIGVGGWEHAYPACKGAYREAVRNIKRIIHSTGT